MRRQSTPDERGQSFLLIPAGFLVLLLMGALVLEAAALHLHQRQLDDIADSVASDAAGLGFDEATFRMDGIVRIDRALATEGLGSTIAFSNLPDATLAAVNIDNGATPEIEVLLSYEHEYILGRALLGGTTKQLSAVGRAALVPSLP